MNLIVVYFYDQLKRGLEVSVSKLEVLSYGTRTMSKKANYVSHKDDVHGLRSELKARKFISISFVSRIPRVRKSQIQ